MYISSLNRCRTFFPLDRPIRLPSAVQDGIVKSGSEYGAYFFDLLTVLFRSDRGKCLFGMGWANFWAPPTVSGPSAGGGWSARTGNVTYSSLNFGLCSSSAASKPGK